MAEETFKPDFFQTLVRRKGAGQIDNTRVMHGRRAIIDPKRTVYNALSDLN